MFYVDIPRYGVDSWETVGEFNTKEEAIAFAKQHFGCDDKGRIGLISEVEDEENEKEEK